MDLRFLNISQLGEVTGLDRRTVTDRLKDVTPIKTHGKAIIYDAPAVLPIILGMADITALNAKEKLLIEQAQHEKAKRERAQIELEQLKKEVVPISDVAKVVGDEYSRVRARLYAIPSRSASDLSESNNPRECQQIVHNEIDEALSELTADKKYQEIEHVDEPSENTEADSTEESQAITET
jgi:hypothetical protein